MADCLAHVPGLLRVARGRGSVSRPSSIAPRCVDIGQLQGDVSLALVAVDPWPSTSRTEAALAVQSFLFDASRAGLVKRRTNGWKFLVAGVKADRGRTSLMRRTPPGQ